MLTKRIFHMLMILLLIVSTASCSVVSGVLGGEEETSGAAVLKEPSSSEIADEVLWSFYAMCKIPHLSGNERELSAHLQFQLEKMGLKCIRDAQNNIIAEVPATPGYEASPLTILQGHMDMVNAAQSAGRPALNPVNIVVTGVSVQSDKQTALGADCGIGIAAALYLAERPEFLHGPLRLIFTTGGEDYMDGANAVADMHVKDAQYLINLTGFQSGTILAGSAAGRRETYQMPLRMEPLTKSRAIKIEIKGFQGGHYGGDIWRERANPIKIMAEVLARAEQVIDYQLVDWKAGGAVDSIPGRCEAVVALDQYDSPAFEKILYDMMYEIEEKYGKTEPGGELTYSVAQRPAAAWSAQTKQKTIHLINGFLDGIYSLPAIAQDELEFMTPDMLNEVSASSSVERISVRSGMIRIVESIKSDSPQDMQALVSHNAGLNQAAGFAVSVELLEGWTMDERGNQLITIMSDAYGRRTGNVAHVMSGHTDLEIPIFLKKNPAMHAVAIGPDIVDAHTVNEYVRIGSIGPFVKTLASALRDIALEESEL